MYLAWQDDLSHQMEDHSTIQEVHANLGNKKILFKAK